MKEKGAGKVTAVAREQSSSQDRWKEPSVKVQLNNHFPHSYGMLSFSSYYILARVLHTASLGISNVASVTLALRCGSVSERMCSLSSHGLLLASTLYDSSR